MSLNFFRKRDGNVALYLLVFIGVSMASLQLMFFVFTAHLQRITLRNSSQSIADGAATVLVKELLPKLESCLDSVDVKPGPTPTPQQGAVQEDCDSVCRQDRLAVCLEKPEISDEAWTKAESMAGELAGKFEVDLVSVDWEKPDMVRAVVRRHDDYRSGDLNGFTRVTMQARSQFGLTLEIL